MTATRDSRSADKPASRDRRRRLLETWLLAASLLPVRAMHAAESAGATAALPGAARAHEVIRGARTANRPLLLMFSLQGCAYCEALRREQLIHVHRDAERLGVSVLELDVQDSRPLAEPFGASANPVALAARLGVRVAPTLVFLDANTSTEVAPRLVGYASRDFYGAYLDERIAQARKAVGAH